MTPLPDRIVQALHLGGLEAPEREVVDYRGFTTDERKALENYYGYSKPEPQPCSPKCAECHPELLRKRK